MDNWYLLSVIALILLGGQRFLYKVAAEKKCSSSLTTAVFMTTVTVLSGTVYVLSDTQPQNLFTLLSLSSLNSVAFAVSTITHIEALRRLPAGLTFPLTRLSLLLVVIVSVLFFDETLKTMQCLGVLTGMAVVVILAQETRSTIRERQRLRSGLFFVAICLLSGAVASISSKLAAETVSKSGFMTLSYFFGIFFSLGIDKKWGSTTPKGLNRDSILLGVIMGVLNFFGFYAFLMALSSGPLSAIVLITGMHFVIAILLSVLIYHERLSLLQFLGISLTLLTVLLLQ